MLNAFHAELQKARRQHGLLPCALVPLVVLVWLLGKLAPSGPEELSCGYSALFYSMPILNALLLPVMMAVFVSRLWK